MPVVVSVTYYCQWRISLTTAWPAKQWERGSTTLFYHRPYFVKTHTYIYAPVLQSCMLNRMTIQTYTYHPYTFTHNPLPKYLHVHLDIHAHIPTTHIHLLTPAHMHTYTYTYIHEHITTYIHTLWNWISLGSDEPMIYIHTHIRIYAPRHLHNTQIHMCTHVHIHTYVHTYTHHYICTYSVKTTITTYIPQYYKLVRWIRCLYRHKHIILGYTHIHIPIHAHIQLNAPSYIEIYAPIYQHTTYIHIHTHVHIHTYIHTYIHTHIQHFTDKSIWDLGKNLTQAVLETVFADGILWKE